MCEKVTSTNCKDDRIISKTLNEATRMTLKYLDGEECADAAKKLGKSQKVVLQFFFFSRCTLKVIDYRNVYKAESIIVCQTHF